MSSAMSWIHSLYLRSSSSSASMATNSSISRCSSSRSNDRCIASGLIEVLIVGTTASLVFLDGIQVVPAPRLHTRQPSTQPGALILFGDTKIQRHPWDALVGKVVAQAALEVIGYPCSDGATAGRVRIVPVLHIVGLGQARWAGIAHHVPALRVFNHLGRILVDLEQPPALRYANLMGMPLENALLLNVDIGEDQGTTPMQVSTFIFLGLLLARLSIILVHLRRFRLPCVDVGRYAGKLVDAVMAAVPQLSAGHLVAGLRESRAHGMTVAVLAFPLWTNSSHVDGTVRGNPVQRVTVEAKGGKLPVARQPPAHHRPVQLHTGIFAVQALETPTDTFCVRR